MNEFLEFKDLELKEEYQRHVHHEVIACRKHYLFFFYGWCIFDFAIMNFLAYRADTRYNYLDAAYSIIELVIKIAAVMIGFRYFLRSHKRFIYVDSFFIIAYSAASIYTVIQIMSYDLDLLWSGYRVGFLMLIQVLTIRRAKFQTFYFILFSACVMSYCIYRVQQNYEIYIVDLVYMVGLYMALNFTLELSFKQNFMEKYSISLQENVWEKIMNILPEGTLIVDSQNRAHFCNPAFIKLIDIDERSSESLYDSLYRVKEVKLRPECPDLKLKPKSPVQSGIMRAMSFTRAQANHERQNEENANAQELDVMKIKHNEHEDEVEESEYSDVRIYDNLKTLVKLLLNNMSEYKERGVGWDVENSEPKFFIADASLEERNLEIKIGYSTFNENKAIILIFTDTTQSYKVARLQDNDNFKSNLLASISHEVRTPLNATISLIEIAVTSGNVSSEVIKDLLLPALSSTKRLEYFVKDVSDFNDLHQDKLGLTIEPCEIRAVIEEVVKLIRIPAESKGLEMKVELAEDIPLKIVTDADRMCQVIVNLLSNSLRFTNQGRITLEVSLDTKEPNVLVFDVIDTGTGMSEAEKDRLFNLLDSGKLGKVSQGSTGASLGISISYALSLRLGNGLRLLSSELNKGSHFQFTVFNNNTLEKRATSVSIQSIISKKKAIRESRMNQHNQISLPRGLSSDSNLDIPAEHGYGIEETKLGLEFQQRRISKELKQEISLKKDDGNIKNEVVNENNSPLEEGQLNNFPQRLNTPTGSKRLFSGSPVDVVMKKRPGSSQGATKGGNQVMPSSVLPPIGTKFGGWMNEVECSCPEIVVVDDEQINQIAMEWILRKLNIKFESALNGIEALKLVTRLEQRKCGCRGIKFMLLDLGMPEMDGYETASRLKDMMIKNEVKGFFMIACTAYVGEEIKKKCIKAGFDDFINKPITIDKVTKLQQKYSKKHMNPNIIG